MSGLLVAFSLVCVVTGLGATAKLHSASNPISKAWRIVKIGSHDYLTADNIAEFYGLPAGVEPVGKTIHLENEKGSLEFTLGSRDIMINGARNWLSFPVIEKDGKYLISRLDLAETIEPQLRPHMIGNIGKVRTVVLDPGHGGYDKGAISRYGCEKDYTLDVARQLRPLLQAKGFHVLMTREGDYFVPLEVRARIANAAPDAIFVSIHFNATDANAAATGFEIYSLTPRGAPSTHDDFMKASADNTQNGTPVDTHSIELSACIYHSVLGHIGEFDRGIKRARFAVLRQTRVPSVLIEGGFLTERGESKLIASKEWRGKLAQSISIGIDNYKSLADGKLPPLLVRDYHGKAEPTAFPSDTQLQSIASVPEAPAPATPPAATPKTTPIDLTRAVIVP
ncbi:MAG TPA: N-acetylmuramoyl-L-alanine amidase [Chthoniobacterales bacterium]